MIMIIRRLVIWAQGWIFCWFTTLSPLIHSIISPMRFYFSLYPLSFPILHESLSLMLDSRRPHYFTPTFSTLYHLSRLSHFSSLCPFFQFLSINFIPCLLLIYQNQSLYHFVTAFNSFVVLYRYFMALVMIFSHVLAKTQLLVYRLLKYQFSEVSSLFNHQTTLQLNWLIPQLFVLTVKLPLQLLGMMMLLKLCHFCVLQPLLSLQELLKVLKMSMLAFWALISQINCQVIYLMMVLVVEFGQVLGLKKLWLLRA